MFLYMGKRLVLEAHKFIGVEKVIIVLEVNFIVLNVLNLINLEKNYSFLRF